MAKKKSSKSDDPLATLFSGLRPTEKELAAIKEAERSGDPERFARQLSELDRKYKKRSLDMLEIDNKLINPNASRPVTKIPTAYPIPMQSYPVPIQSGFGIIGKLKESKKLACDCLVPFKFRRLDVYGNMSGPEQDEVVRGVIGAMRAGTNDYTVWNPGDSDSKYRAPLNGQMHISFSAEIPEAGRWCLIHPAGALFMYGHSRVVGHGNSTTSYDAKVWVDYYQVLQVGGTLLEISGGRIHYDGTRSEDRTRSFSIDRYLPPRYLFFDVSNSGDTLLLTLRLEVDTAANEDGLATGVVDIFGFPAVDTDDYDTFVIKAP